MAEVCTQGIDTGFVALGYGKVAFLGVVQGITELLPISSTAHMRIIPAVLGWQDPGSAFSAAMQMAALFAVISYFWGDMRDIVFGSAKAVMRRDFTNWHFRFAAWIVLATMPIVICGLLLSGILNQCGSPLRSLLVIGLSSLLMAVLLAIAEMRARHTRTIDHVSLFDAMCVGCAQVGALIAGVSRSGSTLTAALFLGLKREEAARFSFLLGVPAIALAGLKEFFELWKAHLDGHGWSVLALGLAMGTVSSFAAIWGLMRFLERFSSWPFVIYRAIMGLSLIVAFSLGWLT